MIKKLILTIGLPRSGKSTWAKKQNIPIVNPDSIRLALHGHPYISESENFVWSIAYLMAKALFIAGHDQIIIDATNTTDKRRKIWINEFPSYKIIYKLFDTSKEVCIKRAKECDRLDLIPIIEKMSENYEKPN